MNENGFLAAGHGGMAVAVKTVDLLRDRRAGMNENGFLAAGHGGMVVTVKTVDLLGDGVQRVGCCKDFDGKASEFGHAGDSDRASGANARRGCVDA
jgi:hypothetical protein